MDRTSRSCPSQTTETTYRTDAGTAKQIYLTDDHGRRTGTWLGASTEKPVFVSWAGAIGDRIWYRRGMVPIIVAAIVYAAASSRKNK